MDYSFATDFQEEYVSKIQMAALQFSIILIGHLYSSRQSTSLSRLNNQFSESPMDKIPETNHVKCFENLFVSRGGYDRFPIMQCNKNRSSRSSDEEAEDVIWNPKGL